jgi:hypothetical protein
MRDHVAIEVLGDPWSMLVLRDVIFGRSSAGVFGDTSFAGMTRLLLHRAPADSRHRRPT